MLMVKLGVISDTHGRLHPGVWDAFADVDCIIHAGDIGDPFILDELGALAPVLACLGNNDWQNYGPSVGAHTTKRIEGCRVLITHTPFDAERYIRGKEYDLIVHGHTHEPRDEVKSGVRIVNPGSATRPRGGTRKSVMLLEITGAIIGPSKLVELE